MLIYMPPCEVYAVLSALIQSSELEKSNSETKSKLGWHIPCHSRDYSQLVSAFLDCYFENHHHKKRKRILEHCLEMGINFDSLIHSMLNTMLTSVVSLDIATHIMMVFLIEGQQVLFKLMFGCLKVNEEFFFTLYSRDHFLQHIRANTFQNLKVYQLLEGALKTKIVINAAIFEKQKTSVKNRIEEPQQDLTVEQLQKAENYVRKRKTVLYRRNKGEEVKEEEENEELSPSILQHAKLPSDVDLSNLPNFEFKSSIISYLDFVRLWRCLPPYVSIRKPEKIYETAEDGYNLLSMYNKCRKFLDEQDLGGADREYYHFTLMLVKTERDFVFGAFISAFPLYSARKQFKGTQ